MLKSSILFKSYICVLAVLIYPYHAFCAPGDSSALSPEVQAKIAAAMSEADHNRDAEAFDLMRQVVASAPGNAHLNLLAAGEAIESMQPDLALQYALKAEQLDPGDWTIHLTLLAAYAGMGNVQERERQRAIVRQFHFDGAHPEAAQSTSFMVEYFPVRNYRVRAIEYFLPQGEENFAYRFQVYDQSGRQVWSIALESDDLSQPSWIATHHQLAAIGQREYSLEGYGEGNHTLYRNFSGKPSYDDVRAEVVKILNAPTTVLRAAE